MRVYRIKGVVVLANDSNAQSLVYHALKERMISVESVEVTEIKKTKKELARERELTIAELIRAKANTLLAEINVEKAASELSRRSRLRSGYSA